MDNFFIAQIFGFCAFVTAIISIFQKSRLRFIVFMILQSIFLCFQYYFLSKIIAVGVCAVSIFRLIVFSFKDKYNRKIDILILYIFTIMNVTVSVITFEIWYDIFPLIASTLVCYTIWQRKIIIMKWGLLLSKILWLVYASISLAYFSIITNIFVIISSVIYIYRFYSRKKINIR